MYYFRSSKLVKMSLLHLDFGGHGDHSMKLFGGHKHCYNGQRPLTGRYFKRGVIAKFMILKG